MYNDNININNDTNYLYIRTDEKIKKKYNDSKLGYINKFTIKILDNNGKNLNITNNKNLLDYNVELDKKCICNDDDINYNCPCVYFRHPYYYKFQNEFVFRFEIQDTEINNIIY
jgi:hypothetical protein